MIFYDKPKSKLLSQYTTKMIIKAHLTRSQHTGYTQWSIVSWKLVYIYLFGLTWKTYFTCFVFLPGVGDFAVEDISQLPDPCPLPEKEKKRSLNEKEKLLYAPMCGVGGVMYDKVKFCKLSK